MSENTVTLKQIKRIENELIRLSKRVAIIEGSSIKSNVEYLGKPVQGLNPNMLMEMLIEVSKVDIPEVVKEQFQLMVLKVLNHISKKK